MYHFLSNLERTVYFDQFLDINCKYLNPNELDNSFFGNVNDLSIYHNNIRSLKKNFCKVEDELFGTCSRLPDILAFSETRINNNTSNIPSLNGYNFEHNDSKSFAGGVGVYISNSFDYSINNHLQLQLPDCEDLWLELVSKKKNP